MTRAEMMCWLQDAIDYATKSNASASCDCGDLWDDMEDWMLESEGVQWAFDPYLGEVYFLCDDGILSTALDRDSEGKTVWIVPEYDVDTCVFQGDEKDVDESVKNAKEILVGLVAFKKLVDGQHNGVRTDEDTADA